MDVGRRVPWTNSRPNGGLLEIVEASSMIECLLIRLSKSDENFSSQSPNLLTTDTLSQRPRDLGAACTVQLLNVWETITWQWVYLSSPFDTWREQACGARPKAQLPSSTRILQGTGERSRSYRKLLCRGKRGYETVYDEPNNELEPWREDSSESRLLPDKT